MLGRTPLTALSFSPRLEMVSILLKRLRLNFLTFRFWIGFLLLLFLSVPAALIGVGEYSRRLELYTARRDADLAEMKSEFIRMYLQTHLILHRPPEPLSILATGLGERFGSVVTIRGKYGPSKMTSRDRSNFLLPLSAGFDYAFLAAVVLSLIAMFLAYDTIAGEREQGTLQLALANTIPRYRVLLGEYWGVTVSVSLPSAVAFLIVLMIISLEGAIEFNQEISLRLFLFFLYQLLFISTFVLLGLLISSLVRSSSTALMVAFLVWVALAVLYPNAAAWGCHFFKPLDKIPAVNPENIIAQADEEEYLYQSASQEATERQKELYRNRNFEQARWQNRLWLFSPFSNFILMTQGIAGTDLGSHERFLRQAQALEQSLSQWQEAKVRRYPLRERIYREAFGPLDLSEMPAAEYQPEDRASLLRRLLPAGMMLLLWNVVLFLMAYVTCIRYDPRFG